jgi:hypothetical protein
MQELQIGSTNRLSAASLIAQSRAVNRAESRFGLPQGTMIPGNRLLRLPFKYAALHKTVAQLPQIRLC